MFAGVLPSVEDMPQLGPLILRIPLAERVAVTEKALLCPGLFLVTSPSAGGSLELQFRDSFQQGHRLERIAARVETGLLLATPLIDRVLHVTHNQTAPHRGHHLVAEVQR